MRRLILALFVLTIAVLALATCKSSIGNRAEKYYEPVNENWMSVEVPLVTETDLTSQ